MSRKNKHTHNHNQSHYQLHARQSRLASENDLLKRQLGQLASAHITLNTQYDALVRGSDLPEIYDLMRRFFATWPKQPRGDLKNIPRQEGLNPYALLNEKPSMQSLVELTRLVVVQGNYARMAYNDARGKGISYKQSRKGFNK
ncbi:hypothetical protein KW805_02580 [Candidatus Pacearchaeota archaeon]|nr:hypothetical protein [Candidatus Pacearchaeota archaeon]